jgi:hypothetical protein
MPVCEASEVYTISTTVVLTYWGFRVTLDEEVDAFGFEAFGIRYQGRYLDLPGIAGYENDDGAEVGRGI